MPGTLPRFAGAKVRELFEITKQFPHFFLKKFILQAEQELLEPPEQEQT